MLESLPLPSPKMEAIAKWQFNQSPTPDQPDALIVGLTEGGDLLGSLADIDRQGEGWVQRLIDSGNLTGKSGELTLLASASEGGPALILIAGLGRAEQVSRNELFNASSAAIRRLIDKQRGHIVHALAEAVASEDTSRGNGDAIVAGALYGCEGQGIYHSDPAMHVPSRISFAGLQDREVERGRILGESINWTRRLVNEPAAMIYPESFAHRTVEMAESVGLETEVWDEARLESEGCRAILAVGGGSARPPRLLIMRHNGGGDEAPLAIVGKGVTFDSGGLSLKPSEGMTDMKCDMAGAATVVGVMRGLAMLGVKRNVIGVCGLAENMVSGNCYKLGDVIETRSSKTIEILNTDAEGRVVLADTLDVAVQHQPSSMVDLATLTGACMVALGNEVAGLMTNDESLCQSIQAAAQAEGEPVWQLPMFDLYDEKVKSKVADIKNVGEGRWGGAITAAKFLQNFVGDVPWVHIDIAGPAFNDSPKPFRDAGASGAMVRSLIHWIESDEAK